MIYVRVHKLDSQARDVSVGILYIKNDNTIACYPSESKLLQDLLHSEIDSNGPKEFLETLHHSHQSAYLRVGPVEETTSLAVPK